MDKKLEKKIFNSLMTTVLGDQWDKEQIIRDSLRELLRNIDTRHTLITWAESCDVSISAFFNKFLKDLQLIEAHVEHIHSYFTKELQKEAFKKAFKEAFFFLQTNSGQLLEEALKRNVYAYIFEIYQCNGNIDGLTPNILLDQYLTDNDSLLLRLYLRNRIKEHVCLVFEDKALRDVFKSNEGLASDESDEVGMLTTVSRIEGMFLEEKSKLNEMDRGRLSVGDMESIRSEDIKEKFKIIQDEMNAIYQVKKIRAAFVCRYLRNRTLFETFAVNYCGFSLQASNAPEFLKAIFEVRFLCDKDLFVKSPDALVDIFVSELAEKSLAIKEQKIEQYVSSPEELRVATADAEQGMQRYQSFREKAYRDLHFLGGRSSRQAEQLGQSSRSCTDVPRLDRGIHP